MCRNRNRNDSNRNGDAKRDEIEQARRCLKVGYAKDCLCETRRTRSFVRAGQMLRTPRRCTSPNAPSGSENPNLPSFRAYNGPCGSNPSGRNNRRNGDVLVTLLAGYDLSVKPTIRPSGKSPTGTQQTLMRFSGPIRRRPPPTSAFAIGREGRSYRKPDFDEGPMPTSVAVDSYPHTGIFRIADAISSTLVSSAKCPESRNSTAALGTSRLNASAPGGMKKLSFLPHMASNGGRCILRYC